MKVAKEYVFKDESLLFDYIFTAFCLVFMLWTIVGMKGSALVIFLIDLVPAIMIWFLVNTLLVKLQFKKYDEGKKASINLERNKLALTYGGQTITIHSNDIINVETYKQDEIWMLGTNNYMVIHTAEQAILLTQFTVPALTNDKNMELFLKRAPHAYYSKQFNYIDKKKFQLA